MTATIYAVPAEIPKPDFDKYHLPNGRFDHNAFREAENAYERAVVEWCKTHGPQHPLVGEVYRTPAGDGYAEYVVLSAKPLKLVHLESGDALQMSDIERRGLTLADIKRAKQLREVWAAATQLKGREAES